MSVKAMSLVWEHFPRGGSDMLVMLALADWCNHDGLSLHPSIRAIAGKCRFSEVQARRVIHALINDGYLEVVGNHAGGAPGASRQYRLRLDRLTPITGDSPRGLAGDRRTPVADDSPTPISNERAIAGDRALTHDRDASHGRSETPLMGESQTVIEPLLTVKDTSKTSSAKSAKEKKSKLPANFSVSNRVRTWAAKSGFGLLDEHLEAFCLAAQAKGYTYVDWDAAFMTAIRDDWARLRNRQTERSHDARYVN